MTDTHAHVHADPHGHAPKHPYHLVDPSPWPLVGSIAAGLLAGGGVLYMHGYGTATMIIYEDFDNVINCYLDIELGDSVLMSDWCYVCDFDHRMDDITLPIKDQGIVKSPIRIGPDTWVGVKVTVLRGTTIGRGCVLGSHAVVRGDVPDFSIAVGAPAKVVKNRQLAWETSAAQRAELAAALADIERKKAAR